MLQTFVLCALMLHTVLGIMASIYMVRVLVQSMTNINLYCLTCGLTAKRLLLNQIACRGTRETACEPALCPAGHGYMVRKDGVVQEFLGGCWTVTGYGIT